MSSDLPHAATASEMFLRAVVDRLDQQNETLRQIRDRLPERVVIDVPAPSPSSGPVPVAIREPAPTPAAASANPGRVPTRPVPGPPPPAKKTTPRRAATKES